MPRPCTVCQHPQRAAVERALALGESNRRIAAEHGLDEKALRRHKSEHLARAMAAAAAIAPHVPPQIPPQPPQAELVEVPHAAALLNQVHRLGGQAETWHAAAVRLLTDAEKPEAEWKQRCTEIVGSWRDSGDDVEILVDRLAAELCQGASALRNRAMAIREGGRAVRTSGAVAQLLGKVTGELQSGTTVNVIQSPVFTKLVDVIFAALAPFDDARAAVVAAMRAHVEARRAGGAPPAGTA